MTLIDLKGQLIARQGNLAAELRQKRQVVILIEADLVRARREEATVNGALQGTEQALADVAAAIGDAAKPAGLSPAPGAGVPASSLGMLPATTRNG